MKRIIPLLLLFFMLSYQISPSTAPSGPLSEILWSSRAHYTLIYAAAVLATTAGLVMERD